MKLADEYWEQFVKDRNSSKGCAITWEQTMSWAVTFLKFSSLSLGTAYSLQNYKNGEKIIQKRKATYLHTEEGEDTIYLKRMTSRFCTWYRFLLRMRRIKSLDSFSSSSGAVSMVLTIVSSNCISLKREQYITGVNKSHKLINKSNNLPQIRIMF